MMQTAPHTRVSLADIGSEPYRVFFPAGVLAGLTGAALWPLHFAGIARLYPGQAHARIMACGLLGGFIFGFLSTAMPRMLSAPPMGIRNVLILLTIHLSMVACYAFEAIRWGDHLFLLALLFLICLLVIRFQKRTDMPPPGFSLVALALFCALGGSVIGLLEHYQSEPDAYWILLRRLLLYQGFILLPVLGIGPFLLPRFFGLQSEHDFPQMRVPNSAWLRKAAFAVTVGAIVVASLFLEASGWPRLAPLLRFAVTLIYLVLEFPFRRARGTGGALGLSLWISFSVMAAGFLAIALFPAYRVGLLHLSLIGGFATITFVVATRIVFGHSGNLQKLKGRNRWLVIAVSLMLLATATRSTADLWPSITISHYVYGALAWIAATLLWSWFVLPKTLKPDR